MDRSHPCLRLDVIVTPATDIMRLWRIFSPVDRAFLQLIIGELPLLADSPIDRTLLRTAISFWDTQRVVFNFQGTELSPTVEEYATLISGPCRPATSWYPTKSYQRDACHGFLLLIFGTILFPYSSNLIDGALAQVILQVVGSHSCVKIVLAETIRSLDYVREVRCDRMRGASHLLQIWLLAHIRPFCSSHPFFYITDERSLIARLLQDIPTKAYRAPYHFTLADTTASLPDRFLRVREVRRLWGTRIVQELYFPEHSTDEERAFSATTAYVVQFHPQKLTPVRRLCTPRIPHALQADIPDIESSVQGARRTKLQSIRRSEIYSAMSLLIHVQSSLTTESFRGS
ncbi:hypothetical protein CRG98_039944 [Punica granatum]|uniref:DUF7745 domain-containing protein n=1 Tax=Punica granatum TaxID=22663 RepID=A0A2I0I6M8_PUNGR|nr:hypothetical protein CRG98_039944 [Punica granatum]